MGRHKKVGRPKKVSHNPVGRPKKNKRGRKTQYMPYKITGTVKMKKE